MRKQKSHSEEGSFASLISQYQVHHKIVEIMIVKFVNEKFPITLTISLLLPHSPITHSLSTI